MCNFRYASASLATLRLTDEDSSDNQSISTSTLVQVKPSPPHPIFGEYSVFRYMEHDHMSPGFILAMMNYTIVRISPDGDVECIFALKHTRIRFEHTTCRREFGNKACNH